jgi:hypothetical protein
MDFEDFRSQIFATAARLNAVEARDRVPEKDVCETKRADTIPPFVSVQAALLGRARTWRNVFFATSAVLSVVIIGQQRVIFHKLFQKMNEEIVIVPGSPEFFRVRPGQIPNESVFQFAEFVAANLGTFSFRNVQYQFGKIAEHMHPVARGRFEAELSERIKDWSERKVDQTFAYEPVRQFDLVNGDKGTKYVAAVEGVRTQYVEGHAFSETRNVLLLEFRSQGNLTAEKPYLFELTSLDWLTPEQFEAVKSARGLGNSLARKEKGGLQ